jgi:hypothetical protein
MIERGHFTISRSLLRKLAIEHPDEVLLNVAGKDFKGSELACYLDGLPIGRKYISDCPNKLAGGACGCFR